MTLYEKSWSLRTGRYLVWLTLGAFAAWVFYEPARQIPVAARSIPFVLDYLRGMIPPDLTILPTMWGPLLETVRIAFAGTMLAVVLAVPLSFLAAVNTTPNSTVYVSVRGLLNFLRAMPAMIWAMLFVSLCGLGPLAGVFGIVCHATGTLGKLFLECVESRGPKIREVLEAMQLDGATERQLIRYGLIPEIFPLFASYVLYRLESTIRTSTIMGFVGAGGLGLELTVAIRMFRRKEALAIILVILVLVTAVDFVSANTRRLILRKSGYE